MELLNPSAVESWHAHVYFDAYWHAISDSNANLNQYAHQYTNKNPDPDRD